MTQEFDKNWKSMGLTDDDLKALQEELMLLADHTIPEKYNIITR